MATIKKNELNKMGEAQLKDKLTELKKELMKLNTQKSSGGSLENPGRIRSIRKTIAKMITIQNQKNKNHKEETRKI